MASVYDRRRFAREGTRHDRLFLEQFWRDELLPARYYKHCAPAK